MTSNITEVTGRVFDVRNYAPSAYGRQRWVIEIDVNGVLHKHKTDPDANFPVDPSRLLNGKTITAQVKGAKSQWITSYTIVEN